MKFQVLEHFINRPVEIRSRSGGSFSGILRISDLDSGLIELEPVSEYKASRYGALIISAEDILTIQPIKPRVRYEDGDEERKKSDEDVYCSDLKDCDIESPYILDFDDSDSETEAV